MDATATTLKRARGDSELEVDESTQAGEPHAHQPQFEKQDAPNGGKQDSTGDGAHQPPRKKNRRDKQQRRARQGNNQDCTYCLGIGKPEFASEHHLTECHWKIASDAMNAYELAEGIHKQNHEGEIAALKARHDAEVRTLKDQHEAQIQNLNARVTNLHDKNEDLADRIGGLTEEKEFLASQNDRLHDLIDRMARLHTKSLDELAAQHGKEVAVLTAQYEEEKADKEDANKLMEEEMLRQIDTRDRVRLAMMQSFRNKILHLRQVIKNIEAKRDDNDLAAQHEAELKAVEKRHKEEIKRLEEGCERAKAAREAGCNARIGELKRAEEALQAKLLDMEDEFEDMVDLLRYESEEKNNQLQQELNEEKGKSDKLQQELTEAREKIQSMAKEKIQPLMEKKAALERPKLDGNLQHMAEKLGKEVNKCHAMIDEFNEDREIYFRKIGDLEKELASMTTARRVLEGMLRENGVTHEEIRARVGGPSLKWELDAESSDESEVESEHGESEFEQSTDPDSEYESVENTNVEMREGDTDVDEEEEGEEEQEEEIEADRGGSLHGLDDSDRAEPDSADEDMSDVVSESTEPDDDEESSSDHEEVTGNEENRSFRGQEPCFFENDEERSASLPLVTGALPANQSQPYNPATPFFPIPSTHKRVTIGEGARQMTYVHDPHEYLSGGYWVETANLNSTPIPQQQRSTDPSPTRSVGEEQEDDDESTTLDFGD